MQTLSTSHVSSIVWDTRILTHAGTLGYGIGSTASTPIDRARSALSNCVRVFCVVLALALVCKADSDDGIERALDNGDWKRAFFFFFGALLCSSMLNGHCDAAFDLDTIKLLMQLFVRVIVLIDGVWC